ncbi:hypothetical protein ACTXT7_016055, partial [Hymenolepis weldensis]
MLIFQLYIFVTQALSSCRDDLIDSPFSFKIPDSIWKYTCTHILTRVLDQVTRINSLYFNFHTHADMLIPYLFVRFPLISALLHLPITLSNRYRDLVNAFWPTQLFMFYILELSSAV